MFNFLRNLRRNTHPSTTMPQQAGSREGTGVGKYLRYAIGEIILVVIGIFIAVQFSNWNEERKEKRVMKDQLELLKNDLNEDLVELNKLDQVFDNLMLKTDSLFRFFKTQLEPSHRLNEYLIDLMIETNFKSQQNAYEILKESGNFSKLKVGLQKELMQYYATIREVKEREDISNAFIREKYEVWVLEYTKLFNKKNSHPAIQEVYADDPRVLDSQYIFNLAKDRKLEGMVFGRHFQNKAQQVQYKKAIAEIESILEFLNND